MVKNTIAAIATAMGNSGIAIIRISGDEAIEIASKIFVPKNTKTDLSKAKSHTMHFGNIVNEGEIIDEVLVSVMRAPKTYTTEDIVEINCHGGMTVAYKILNLVIAKGARSAEPGEFTKRAFLNGRIDLSQAEAVIDVINAKNNYALKSAVNSLKGKLSEKIKELREIILTNMAFIEATLDDPEHMSFDGYNDKISKDINYLNSELDRLIVSSDNGRILANGINTVILGKPNAGKSSFLNAIMGEDRAIVTDIEGTTRDALVETINLDGITLNITDTAGIRETSDIIEQMGIEKAKKIAEEADLILYIIDASRIMDDNDKTILDIIKDKKAIILINKIDIVEDKNYYDNILENIEKSEVDINNVKKLFISAKESIGINEFSKMIKEMFLSGEVNYNDEVVITNMRQKESLITAKESIGMVERAIEDGMSEDFYSIDLAAAYEELGKIIGEAIEDDLADKIFREFCMGK